MTDDKKVENQPSAKKDAVADSASTKSVSGKQEAIAKVEAKAESASIKSTDNETAKPVDKSATKSTDKTVVKPADKSATKPVEKEAAKPADKAASKPADKPVFRPAAVKISDSDKKNADDIIKTKQSIDDLKARAHEAKLRAQKKILEKSYVSDPPVDPLERLANTFDNSARRWEMVVYPSMFAFVLLAGYGFFLIYRLTHDISTLSQSVTRMAVIVSDAMPRMTKDLNVMTGSMDNMTGNIADMSTEISSMSGQMDSLTPMSNNIQSMTQNVGSMNRSVYGMQRDMHGMNRTVSSGPFGMMNDVMPFSSNTNVPPSMAPPPVWPAYNNNPVRQQPYSPPTVAPVKPAAVPQENIKTEVTMPGASPVTLKEPSSPESSAVGK
jgi:methyl-accepting chemotaxis protein